MEYAVAMADKEEAHVLMKALAGRVSLGRLDILKCETKG